MPTIAAELLTDYATRILEGSGVPAADARVVAVSLVGANLRGHDSHGVLRLPQYVDFIRRGEYAPGADLTIERDGPAVVTADAGWGLGQVQAHRLLGMVMERAKAGGVAAGAARHCGHVGRLGEYAERAAAEGLVLIASVNNCGSGQRVAPPGGMAPRLGTNPLCIGVPTSDDPVVLDFGTSVVAEGKVRAFYLDGKKPVPEGWLLDAEGRPSTDSAVLYEPPFGSIRPMGGDQAYKGFGLALALDLLVAGLSGGRSCFAGAPAAKGNNLLFVAFDPGSFAGADALLAEANGLASFVRETPRASGVEAILLPGDPERRALRRREAEGIPLPDGHWAKLAELAGSLGVAVPPLA